MTSLDIAKEKTCSSRKILGHIASMKDIGVFPKNLNRSKLWVSFLSAMLGKRKHSKTILAYFLLVACKRKLNSLTV